MGFNNLARSSPAANFLSILLLLPSTAGTKSVLNSRQERTMAKNFMVAEEKVENVDLMG